MIPFAATLVTRVRTLTCAVLTSQYKQTPFKTLSLLRFVFMNRFPGHKLYMQGILFTNEVCGEILGQNFVYQTQMTLNKRPLCFLFREKSAWFVSCLLFFCFTSSVSSKRGKCQILVVWGKHASLRHTFAHVPAKRASLSALYVNPKSRPPPPPPLRSHPPPQSAKWNLYLTHSLLEILPKNAFWS